MREYRCTICREPGHAAPTCHLRTLGDLITHRLPLRPDTVVTASLPRNMTEQEARRISTWIESLALPAQHQSPDTKEGK